MLVSPFLVINLILAHARSENLFTSESSQFNLDAPFDDASIQLNSNDVSSDSTSVFLDPSDQEIDFPSDMDSFGNFNNLFASNTMDLTALPDCKAEGSQTDGGLQARDGSCQSQETIDLPTGLFQDGLEYLRDNLGTPLRGQINQPGQGAQKDENANPVYPQMHYQPNEEQCPTRLFRTANIPICENPLTGALEREIGSNAFRAYNVVPCQCHVTHFASFTGLFVITDLPARRSSGMPRIFTASLLLINGNQSESILPHYLSVVLFDPA